MPPILRFPRAWIALLVFMTMATASGCAAGEAFAVQAQAGTLRLTDADLHRTVDLAGEWELYWGNLLTPQDFRAGLRGIGAAKRMIRVPRSWNDPANGLPWAGSATYRLLVTLPEVTTEPLGLYLKNIASAYRLYCNGALLAENGTVSSRVDLIRGTYAPRTDFFEAHGALEIVLQVSNAEEAKAGVNTAPRFGYQSSIAPVGSGETILEAIIYAFVLAMGIYHILLSIIHPEEKASLYFGLLAVDLALRGALTGSRILHQFAGGLGFHTLIAAEFITVYAAGAFVFLCFYHLFPRERPTAARIPVLAVAGAYSLFVILAPIRTIVAVHLYYEIFLLAEGVLLVIWLIRSLVARREGSVLMLIGLVVMLGGATYDIIIDQLHTYGIFVTSYAMVIFIFLQAALIARRYARAFYSARDNLKISEALASGYGRFVPREFLSLLGKESIVNVELGDQIEMNLTVLFADIRSFTSLSEKMTPAENFNFLNSFLRRVSPVIRRNSGFIDKYMGDGIMALFPRSPADALRAGVELLETVRLFNRHRANSGYQPIAIGVGINSGRLMLGTVGEASRMEGTVISDVVNLTSRLQGLTRMFGSNIIVSRGLIKVCPDTGGYPRRYLGSVPVRGKSEVVALYEIIDTVDQTRVRTRDRFEAAVHSFERERYSEAAARFRTVLTEDPLDVAARHYIDRLVEIARTKTEQARRAALGAAG
jgi:class 3 adenylate cyclase